MNSKTHEEKVAGYLAELLQKTDVGFESVAAPLEESVEESAFGSERERELVQSAGSKLQTEETLTSEEAFALEAIILPDKRPVIDVLFDSFHAPTQAAWTSLGEGDRRKNLEAAIRAVGRVNLIGHPRPYSGTGFMVSRNVIMTNRHVADDFAEGLGTADLAFIPGLSSEIDLKQEVRPSDPIILEVQKVLMIHPHWDAALVEVTGFPADREPLKLAGEQPQNVAGRVVAAIGYPGFDARNDVNVQNRVFHGYYYVKRLQPGEVTKASAPTTSFQHQVNALTHDCSTLGGNSGSAIVDVDTGEVLGLHFAGVYLEANYAVPTWELALDPRFREFGVNLSSTPPSNAPPPQWLSAWDNLPKSTTVAIPGGVPATPPQARGEGLPMPAGWFERLNDDELARVYEENPEATRRELVKLLGEQEADDLISDIREANRLQQTRGGQEGLFDGEEGFFWTRPDPDLPELVLLHGIMGGHLAHAGFFRNRLWLDPKELLKGNLPEKMSLRDDGFGDAPGLRIEPDGHIRMKYSKAARKWRKEKFVVHEFSYDWRKGVHYGASALHRFLERRVADNPSASFVLVAHSMGGLVSSLYSQRYPVWQDRVEQAIFLGSPLGGSYSVPVAVTGQDDFIDQMASWSRNDSPEQYSKMASSFPGLIDMLPNPDLFDGAESLYHTAGWPAGQAPRQRWLNQSRNLKPLLREAPILGRTTLLVSLHHGTIEKMPLQGGRLVPGPATGLGDGTVPARSALVDGVPAYKVQLLHGDLAKDPLAIQAVVKLIKDGRTDLDPVKPDDLVGSNPLPESLETMDVSGTVEAREHFQEGYIAHDDIALMKRW